tara:strand:- start:102480 stop:102644 length:165 start_codon:yes stop_codon:yes gene_type:complete
LTLGIVIVNFSLALFIAMMKDSCHQQSGRQRHGTQQPWETVTMRLRNRMSPDST